MSDTSQDPDDNNPAEEREKKRRQWHDRIRTACAVIGALASVVRDIPRL